MQLNRMSSCSKDFPPCIAGSLGVLLVQVVEALNLDSISVNCRFIRVWNCVVSTVEGEEAVVEAVEGDRESVHFALRWESV